jgi:hypothetical protein
MYGGKILETAGNPLSFSCYSVIRKDKRECVKKEKIWQSAAKSFDKLRIKSRAKPKERFRDYNEEFPLGMWYSPFLLETKGS